MRIWSQINPLSCVLLLALIVLLFMLGLAYAQLLLPVYHCL